MPEPIAQGHCQHAAATARELARRLGGQHEPDNQCAVLLIGSKAAGTHGPASDTDLIVVPAWETWPGPGPAYNSERIARRFQKGTGRTHVEYDPNGTDIGLCETWETNDRHWHYIEAQEGDDCWSNGTGYNGPEEHNEGRVNLRLAPPGLIERDLTQVNALIFADTPGILARALRHVRAIPTGPWQEDPRNGLALHIVDSRMFATGTNGRYGRYDFPRRGPAKNKKLPEKPPEPLAPEPEELADAIARLAEETAETVAQSPVPIEFKKELLANLNRIAILADQATDEGARSSTACEEPSQNEDWDEELPF